MKYILSLLVLTFMASCAPKSDYKRSKINLEGYWKFALDSNAVGEHDTWFSSVLNDSIILPGTTDQNKKGYKNTDTTSMHLNRVYTYEGIAWYQKEVFIPESFNNKHITLNLERTKTSKVWIDKHVIGTSQILQSTQKFDVSDYLSPGKHTITIKINNDLKLTPYGNVHIYSNDTQTNWNGILGNLFLEATDKTYIKNLQVYPDINNKKITVNLGIENKLNIPEGTIVLNVEKTINGTTTKLPSKTIQQTFKKELVLDYDLGENMSLWDEYQQPLFKLTATIHSDKITDSKTVSFGMREFKAKGTQFTINNRVTFLRGKHEAAVFPITGFPPMNVKDWVNIYKIAKSYGINHYRFHTYCPPEAAFTAADQEGIYLQVELPFWGGLDSDSIMKMQRREGYAMLDAYANHPSFVMISPGNEIWGGHERVKKNMTALKLHDNRPLYTMGSNNNIGYMKPEPYSDFFVGARIPENGNATIGHTRLTHAFPDAIDGGILNTKTPSTTTTFKFPVDHINMPIISHEIGQYQIYPDYNEIKKYTGVLKADNLEIFKQRLEKSGMKNMDHMFQKASGAWSALCYKAEMEAAIRTKGFGGFQLLDLQDFPGQCTALVGVLDAFMDSKNVVTPKTWKQSCNDIVLLAEFSKYCWTTNDTFSAKVVVANYSDSAIDNAVTWSLNKPNGATIKQGTFDTKNIANQGLSDIGSIQADFSDIKTNEKLVLNLSISNSAYSNSYPIWVYQPIEKLEPSEIVITETLKTSTLNALKEGKSVLYFPDVNAIKTNSIPGLFPPDFWNYEMFKNISINSKKPISPGTLGLLTDPNHPIFNSFPTDFHTNWQWFSIIKESHSLVLDKLPKSYLPIVQVIDNLQRNHKLGLIFEFKVGNGKLLVCMSQLQKLVDKPEALQLYKSILNYMNSSDFNPEQSLDISSLKTIF